LTGVYNLPFNIMGIVGGIVGGIAMIITKEAKTTVVVSFIIMLIGSGLCAVLEPHIHYAAWFFPTAMLGFAVGTQIALLPVVASICTPNHLIAHAISLIGSTRAFGGSIGVVIFRYVPSCCLSYQHAYFSSVKFSRPKSRSSYPAKLHRQLSRPVYQ